MLHAVMKRKTRYYKRYEKRTPHASDSDLNDQERERHVSQEDEITSTVLGPLDFLPFHDFHRFWQELLCAAGHNKFLPDQSPSRIKLLMWDRRVVNDGTPIEPDVVVTMDWEDGTSRILLIEMKWHSPLSGTNQLHRQWMQYLTEMERAGAVHILIAPNISEGAHAPNNEKAGGNVWQTTGENHLVLMPWLKFRNILSAFSREDSGLGRWARHADQFLERINVRKFGGFNNWEYQISLPSRLPSCVFWQPYRFSGLRGCGTNLVLPHPIPTSVFFPQSRGDK